MEFLRFAFANTKAGIVSLIALWLLCQTAINIALALRGRK